MKQNNKPLVSIILPVYKSEAHLALCLESIFGQTYKNIEIIAVVDYLGDNCTRILRKYKKEDKRLKVYKNVQRYGLSRTLNRAIKRARGEYIAFVDSDGILSKYRISKQVKFLKENKKVATVGSQVRFISVSGSKTLNKSSLPLMHNEIYKGLISGNSFKFESAMIDRTRLPKDILSFNPKTSYPYMYIDVFTKIGKYKQLANLPEELIKSRIFIKDDKRINLEKKLSFIKVLLESTTTHDYKPSLRSLFTPIIT